TLPATLPTYARYQLVACAASVPGVGAEHGVRTLQEIRTVVAHPICIECDPWRARVHHAASTNLIVLVRHGSLNSNSSSLYWGYVMSTARCGPWNTKNAPAATALAPARTAALMSARLPTPPTATSGTGAAVLAM